jgi:hypothetical protein
MPKISREQVEKFESYAEIRGELFTAEEIAENDRRVERELTALKILQDDVSSAVAKYMASERIGFNEFTRRLDTTARQTSLIMKGQANLKLATIAELASIMGKKARIVFEVNEEPKKRASGKKHKRKKSA